MTTRQKALYFRTWSRVRKALTSFGEFSPAEADAQRHEYTRAALGTDKSSKLFTNGDLDKVLDKFTETLVLFDGPGTETRADSQPVARLVFAIESLGLEDPYLDHLAQNQFKISPWRSLTLPQLTRLRYTATARSRAKN
jgi:tRNA(Leu) C34 or U34 (ribose-2'-O)-methylase TrmL